MLQVIPLRGGPDGPVVELLRCRRCTRSSWRRDGADVSREQALGALAPPPPPQAASPAPVAAQPDRADQRRAASAAPARATELRDLLSGWQVLGS